MTPKELDQIERRFVEEHEEQAAAGWPGAWADRPVMLEVTEQLTRDQRDALYGAGTLAFSEYLVATADRYAKFHVEAQTGDRQEAWQSFLDDTRDERRRFQRSVLAKLWDIMG